MNRRQLAFAPMLVAVMLSAAAGESRGPRVDGRELFLRVWTQAQGLGPSFNATSCAACHEGSASRAAPPDESFVWPANRILTWDGTAFTHDLNGNLTSDGATAYTSGMLATS